VRSLIKNHLNLRLQRSSALCRTKLQSLNGGIIKIPNKNLRHIPRPPLPLMVRYQNDSISRCCGQQFFFQR
jgi:hypothetical protein